MARRALIALKLHRVDSENRRLKAVQWEYSQYEQRMTKCMLALRFNVIRQQGVRCLQKKKQTNHKVMAWNALRYYCVLCKIGNDLRSFKQ